MLLLQDRAQLAERAAHGLVVHASSWGDQDEAVDSLGRLVAVDPVTGAVRWKVDYEMPALSSVLATGGGLVFNGDVEGNVFAYAADSGQPLWRFSTGSGLRGGPVSYMAGGKQFIVVPTGLGSHAPGFMASAFPRIKDLPGGGALVAFTLD